MKAPSFISNRLIMAKIHKIVPFIISKKKFFFGKIFVLEKNFVAHGRQKKIFNFEKN